MKQSDKDIIRGIWGAVEENEPDISTERLMSMVADIASGTLKRPLDVGDIADAMKPND